MVIQWTKVWAAIDDGTILRGIDLGNLQDDIEAYIGNATEIHSFPIETPGPGTDGYVLYWNNGIAQWRLKEVVDITGDQTIAGLKTFTGGIDSSYVRSEYLLLDEQSAAPSTAANQGAVYTKDVNGQTHLFYRRESDGPEIQLSRGNLVEVITSSGNWTCPVGVNYIEIELIGGGAGGGGGSNNDSFYGGGGGGAGEYVKHFLKVTPLNTYAIAIGAAGTGGSSGSDPGGDGTNGGDTTFTGDSYTLTASGGVKGSGGNGGVSGPGGSGGGSDTATRNGSGRNPAWDVSFKGGDGGSGSNAGSGTSVGGGGGSTYLTKSLGIGGINTASVGSVGIAGQTPGCGGGGGAPGSSGQGNGAAGAAGVVIIKYNINGAPA